MQRIGKSKIGKLSAKGNDYPQLRLPLQYANTVGDVADVFETEHEGKQAFLIVTEHSVPKEDKVLKPSEEVLKTMCRFSTGFRGSACKKYTRFHATVRARLTLEKHRRKLYYRYLASKLCCVRQSLCVRKPG
jgi:hypothetical protein